LWQSNCRNEKLRADVAVVMKSQCTVRYVLYA